MKEEGFMDTKEKILTVSLGLFSEHGYNGTSLQDIADKIGITKAAFYRHFKNKTDIYTQIVSIMRLYDEMWMEENGLPLEFPEPDEPDPMALLNDFVLRRFRYWTEDEKASAFRRMLIIEQYHNGDCGGLLQSFILSGPLGWLEDCFREMMALDLMRPSDPAQTALNYWSMFSYYIQLYDSGEAECAERFALALLTFAKNNCIK